MKLLLYYILINLNLTSTSPVAMTASFSTEISNKHKSCVHPLMIAHFTSLVSEGLNTFSIHKFKLRTQMKAEFCFEFFLLFSRHGLT